MTKKTTNKAVSSSDTPILPSRRAQQTLEKGLASLDACVDAVADMLGDAGAEYDKDLASHQAWITKHVAQIMGELRKLEAEERAASSKLTPGAVRAYLQALTKEEWSALAREVESHFRGGSVLG